MHWYCEPCRVFLDVIDRSVAARLELDRWKKEHLAQDAARDRALVLRGLAAAAHGVTL